MNERLAQLNDILKKYDGELYMYFNPNSQQKLNDIDLRDLLSSATKWANLSAQGLVCGILGCSDEPNIQCPICSCYYCKLHKSWHFHSATNTGIFEKDSTEMR